jgi:hypothetical protein
MVSGVTSSRSPWRRALGITLSSAASRARSAQVSFGRRGCRRCRTASWWRRIKISAVFHASSRRDSRSHAASRVAKRNRNRRHMNRDHRGRSAGRATLLVRGVDAILGTHRMTKLLFDDATGRVIGCGIVGPGAGDLIAEAAMAIEMGADAADIGLTIHPHPSLSETVAMAAEAFEGTITDLYLPRRG